MSSTLKLVRSLLDKAANVECRLLTDAENECIERILEHSSTELINLPASDFMLLESAAAKHRGPVMDLAAESESRYFGAINDWQERERY
jgi:hypothetical protein